MPFYLVRPRSWREADPDNKDEPGAFSREPRTIVVHEPDSDTAPTGLLDKDGNAIHRRTMAPIGFVRFGR